MEWWQMLLSVIGGGAIVKAGDVVIRGLKERAVEIRADDQQEFSQQDKLFADLRSRIVVLESEQVECLKHKAEIMYEFGVVKGTVAEMRTQMQHIQSSATEQSRQVVQAAGEIAVKGVEAAAVIASESGTRLQAAESKPTPEIAKTEHDMGQIH